MNLPYQVGADVRRLTLRQSAECRMPNGRFMVPMCVQKLEVGATHEPSPALNLNLNLNLNPNPNRRGEIKIKITIKIMSRTPGFMAPIRVQKQVLALHELDCRHVQRSTFNVQRSTA